MEYTPSGSYTKPILSPARDAYEILLHPNTWYRVQVDHISVHHLYTKYIIFLALIPALGWTLRSTIIDHQSVMQAGFYGAVLYVLAFAFPALAALIVETLASFFEGSTTPVTSLKLVTYSYTPWCILTGVLAMFPQWISDIGFILSFYGLYIFYTGIPTMAKVPQERIFAFYFTALMGAALLLVFNLGVMSAVSSIHGLR